MKLKTGLLSTLGCGITLVAGLDVNASLAEYTFTGTTGPVSTAPEVMASAFLRQNVTAASDSQKFASTAWSTGSSYDATEYVRFILLATSGNTISPTSILFTPTSENGGPAYVMAEVFNGGVSAEQSQIWTVAGSQLEFNFQDIGPTIQQVEFRFYGWQAASSAGRLSFDDVIVNGTVAPVPEPVNVALASFGFLAGVFILGRKLSWKATQS